MRVCMCEGMSVCVEVGIIHLLPVDRIQCLYRQKTRKLSSMERWRIFWMGKGPCNVPTVSLTIT